MDHPIRRIEKIPFVNEYIDFETREYLGDQLSSRLVHTGNFGCKEMTDREIENGIRKAGGSYYRLFDEINTVEVYSIFLMDPN
jgi:hypothetical protein